MSEPVWLQARAAGRHLLLSARDLREVLAPSPVVPLPGRPRGIQGVVIHQGEFLPVLAWEELAGCEAPAAPPTALAVLRPRLALPLEQLLGTVEVPPGPWLELGEADPARAWSGGVLVQQGQAFLRVDADRLVDLLRRFRNER